MEVIAHGLCKASMRISVVLLSHIHVYGTYMNTTIQYIITHSNARHTHTHDTYAPVGNPVFGYPVFCG